MSVFCGSSRKQHELTNNGQSNQTHQCNTTKHGAVCASTDVFLSTSGSSLPANAHHATLRRWFFLCTPASIIQLFNVRSTWRKIQSWDIYCLRLLSGRFIYSLRIYIKCRCVLSVYVCDDTKAVSFCLSLFCFCLIFLLFRASLLLFSPLAFTILSPHHITTQP